MDREAHALVTLVVLLGLIAGLGSCVFPSESTTLNVLCSPEQEWCEGMKQEFESKHDITVNYVRLSSGEALARLRAEKDDPQFDLWWGGPIDGYIAAKEEGLLEPYESPSYDNLIDPDKFKDPENQWAGIYAGTLGFCTNRDWLAAHPEVEPPRSWDDLLRPEFAGQVMVAHPATSGTAYTALATILQLKGEDAGWEVLRQLAGQVRQFTRGGADAPRFVGQGEAAVCIAFSHDIVNDIENAKLPLLLTFPEEGTGYEIGGMAILKGARHPDAARKWFDWALTPEAQALGPKYKAYQAPTVQGVQLSHSELLAVDLIDYDFQWAGEHKAEFVDRFTREIAPASNLKE